MMTLLAINNSLFSQENISIFTHNVSGGIVTDTRFISPMDGNLSSLQFSTNNIDSISIGSSTYAVKTGRFNNWEKEPGNFDVIQFYKNNQLVLTYKDADGIVKLNDPSNLYSYSFRQHSNNGYFIDVKISNSITIIIFIGQHYGTDLSKLIIFAITPNEVKLIYNQKVQINSMTKTSNSISITVQSNIPNEGEMAVLHTIWSTDGVLKFKNN